MPAIAAGVERSGAAFYWHLGDFRKISGVDVSELPERYGIPCRRTLGQHAQREPMSTGF